ncbi:flagellar brake protein [Bacillaceae bacterium C204]|uniref:flagellar brake protein n=1 Tax=Neobacillus sp. 204 TaxID=3383351 RepID=UPI003978575C
MYPKVNQKITIDLVSHDLSCKTNVAEVGETEILISIPLDREILGLLSIGTKLEVTFLTGGNKYEFKTEIIGRTKDTIPLLRLVKPKENEIVKIQQRENFRVNSNLRLIINDSELHTINISAGGALFSSRLDFPLREGDEVTGTLFVPNTQSKEEVPISFQSKIIRIMKSQERKNVAIEYTKINRKDQLKIIQHCFEKQRKTKSKEQ